MSKKSELSQFERDLLESVRQAKSGEYASVHTPEQIETRRRGRPVGSTKANAKVSINLRIDPDVLAALKATGRGWQTRMNDVLKEWLKAHSPA
ncbi:MAG: BrnA antitoxin family protein [Desulfobulbus sp.]|nr:BrnA antitoxin family protein [Desulfobulbus sp.]